MDDYVIEFEIEDPKLISTNEQYMHPVRKTKRGSYVSYFAPTPYLKEVQEFYRELFSNIITDDMISELRNRFSTDNNRGISLSIVIGMPSKEINESDSSNYIKALEDCIVKRTGIDDKYNYKVSVEKMIYENEGHWILKVGISTMFINTYVPLRSQVVVSKITYDTSK